MIFPLPSNLHYPKRVGNIGTIEYLKSVQTFEITIGASSTSNTATISGVDLTKSALFFGGFTTTYSGSSGFRVAFPRAELTNSTTITAIRDTLHATATVTVRGTIVEFSGMLVKSVQQGTVTISGGDTSGTATISGIDTTKTAILYQGFTTSGTGSTLSQMFNTLTLTNSTTVTADRGASGATQFVTTGFTALEFQPAAVISVQPLSISYNGNDSTTHTGTVTSVSTINSIVVFNGFRGASGTTINDIMCKAQLSARNTVTLERSGSSGGTSRLFNVTVVNFDSGILEVQRGETEIINTTTGTATIEEVDTARSFLNYNWFLAEENNNEMDGAYTTAKLLNSTTVQADKGTADSLSSTGGWEIVSFL